MTNKFLATFAFIAITAVTGLQADDSSKKVELNKLILECTNLVQTLNADPKTAIDNDVVAKAQGVLIVTQYSGGVILGGSAGSGIGMVNHDGRFSAPAFYSLASGSIGLQIGGSKRSSVVFLISDKAMRYLTESQTDWGVGLRAVAGGSAADKAINFADVDMVIYQTVSGLDIGAAFKGVNLSIDGDSNRAFYGSETITPTAIFTPGTVAMPESAKALAGILDAAVKAAK